MKEHHRTLMQRGLELLRDLDWIVEAHHLGINPDTGAPMPSPEATDRRNRKLHDDLAQQEERFERLIHSYASEYGADAAEAFRIAIRVRHLGGTVITQSPPTLQPLPEAVRAGQFGLEEDGSIVTPDEQEVFEITEQLAEELRDAAGHGRKVLLDKYAEDFGQEAAKALGDWSKNINRVEEEDTTRLQYDPGHPWYYYSQGDAAEPMPVDAIPAGSEPALPKAPKNPRKRLEFLRKMMAEQEQQLRQAKDRYLQLVEEGADALNDFDRNIAHDGNDELAWATAIALKFNHIRFGKARVAALRRTLGMSPCDVTMP